MMALAGAVALALGGTAMANTNLDASSTGDLFFNLVDNTNSTSFLFDTGIAQASFDGTNGSYSFNFASDPNYTAFIAAVGGSDSLDYSVLSATKSTGTPAVGNVFFTATGTVPVVKGSAIQQVITAEGGFFTQANLNSSATTNSSNLNSSNFWGQGGAEGVVTTQLQIAGDSALPGTPIAFYGESSNALRSTTSNATLTTFAHTWDFDSATLTYNVSSVPLPAPLLLLLSGLGMMGVVGRRKSTTDASGSAAV
jgi:hypothetical protein